MMRPFRRSIILASLAVVLVTLSPRLFGSHDIACAQSSGNVAEMQATDVADFNQLVLLNNTQQFDQVAERGPLLWQQILTVGREASELSVRTLQMIIDANHKLGRYSEAVKYEQLMVAIGERHAAPDWAAAYKAAVALDYAALGRFAEAEPLYKEVLAYDEVKRQRSQRITTDIGTTLYDLAELYRDQGRYDDAEPLFKRALAIREKAPRECEAGRNGRCQRIDVVRHSEALSGLASIYRIEGRYAAAEQLLTKALAITQKLNGDDYMLHPMEPNLYSLGALYKDTGRLAEADQYLKSALTLLDRVGREVPYASPPYAVQTLDALGEVSARSGRAA